MIDQLRTLRRIKKMREEKAMAAFLAARDSVRAAEALRDRAQAAVDESALTLRDREQACFTPILGKPVEQADIDEAKHNAAEVEAEHQRLIDRVARAEHVIVERKQAMEEARIAHKQAEQAVDKVDILIEEEMAEVTREAEAKEEVELEDLAGRKAPEFAG
ncbi:MAG: YscO family type III secretion system apparatus protein [Pseudomonadota bacterium]